MDDTLGWEDSYAIALRLKAEHPNVSVEQISLRMIYDWTLELHEFEDDPVMANDEILMAILREWSEEADFS
jgi:FeS assembly protein IscX